MPSLVHSKPHLTLSSPTHGASAGCPIPPTPLGRDDQSHCLGGKSQGTEMPVPVMSLSSCPRAGLPASRLLFTENKCLTFSVSA